jgi:hypothetical protein
MDAIFVVAFSIYCPETRMKTLEEIEALFGDHVAEMPEVMVKPGDDEELKGLDVMLTENANAKESVRK